MPASATFDLLDWNPRAEYAADGSASIGGADGLLSRAFTSGKVFSSAAFVALVADGRALSAGSTAASATVDLLANPPTTFSFEFEVAATADLSEAWDPKQRAYIGLSNQSLPGAALFITKSGLYLATGPADTHPTLLSGTAKFVRDAAGTLQQFVVRCVVNTATARIAVYMGVSSAVYDRANSATWWNTPSLTLVHNLPAKVVLGGKTALEVLVDAPQGADTVLPIYALRVSSTLLSPAALPTAVVDAPWQMQLGQATRLSGLRSYDVTGDPLVYDWTIEHAPAGSTARLQGCSHARATTVIGTPTDSDVVVFSTGYSSRDNQKTLVIEEHDPLEPDLPLVVLVTDDGLVVRPATDSMRETVTTANDLIAALRNPLSPGYSERAAAEYTVELASGSSTGLGVLAYGSYTFGEGTGSAMASCVFVPDVIGPYVFSLRVNNGLVSSKATLHTLSVVHTDELLGEVPDSEYIFKYLPDFWKLVEGREHLSTLWSAVTQVVTSELVQLWQSEYSKSIRDIGRKFQRRWVNFDFRVEAPSNYIIPREYVPGASSRVLANVAVGSTGYTTSRATTYTPYYVAPLAVGPALLRGKGVPLRVVDISSVEQVGADWRVSTAYSEIPTCVKLAEGSALGLQAGTGRYVDAAVNFFTVARAGDWLRVVAPGNVASLRQVLDSYEDGSVATTVALDSVGTERKTTWELLRPVSTVSFTAEPYLQFDSGLPDLGIAFGDLATVSMLDPYTANPLQVDCVVLAVSNTAVFLDWSPVLDALNASAQEAGVTTTWDVFKLAERAVSISHFKRTRASAKVTDLVGAPLLGRATLGADLYEGRDFSVVEERVVFAPVLRGTGAAQAGSEALVLSDTSSWYALGKHPSYAEIQEFGVRHVLIATGLDAGVRAITGVDGAALLLDTVLLSTDTVEAYIPRYSMETPPANTYWAEVAFFDNWRTIEGNFGLMVGLPKKYLLEDNVQVDYLTLVRALCFSFVTGPTLDNLALLTDAFIGVPFVETPGQIVQILEPTEELDGYVVVSDFAGRDVVYRYPRGVELGTHPKTGLTFTAFPLVDEPRKLSVEDKALYDSSVVPAHTKLFVATKVDDYISDAPLVASLLTGQNILSKYHTFVVQVPLNIARTTEAFGLIKTYLNEAKAAYTRFLLVGVLPMVDDITIVDEATRRVTLHPRDTLHTAPFALKAGDPLFVDNRSALFPSYPSIVPDGGGEILKYFADGNVYTEADDAFERHESGYQEGVLDDYSGDGSVNEFHANEVDCVNSLDFDDIDVLNSLVWVPVIKDNTEALADFEFAVGEEVRVILNETPLDDDANYLWGASPPVIVHVGAGQHLKLPGVYTPQTEHPYTYIVLGFNRPQTASSLTDPTAIKTNYGDMRRIDGLQWAAAAVTQLGGLWDDARIEGVTSGARASVPLQLERSTPAHAKYFILERVNRLDKLSDFNLADEAKLSQSVYVPLGTLSIAQVEYAFSAAAGAPLSPYSASLVTRREQLQMHPYDQNAPADEQFVPATAAGVYTGWAAEAGGNPFSIGYADVGAVTATPTAITAFTKQPSAVPVRNAHFGLSSVRAGGWHKTHGFIQYSLPKPRIVSATWDAGTTTLRIEGHYFISPDTITPALIHTSTTYNGQYCGSWVFLVDGGGTETAATTVTFETGVAAGPGVRTVLGVDGVLQTSTGHILEATFPGIPAGSYHILVRHYRPYKTTPGANTQLRIDSDIKTRFSIT